MNLSTRLPLATLVLALSPVAAMAQAPAAAPAAAPAVEKRMVPGLGIVNRDEVIAASNANRNAASERQVIFKNQFAMAEARRNQINAQIEPLIKKFNDDRASGTVAAAELQRQAQAIQATQQAGVQELNTMMAPMRQSEVYVQEQIEDVLSKAIVAAMDKTGVTLVLPPAGILAFNNGYVMSGDVLAELNKLLPRAIVVPPAGWLPKAQRDAQAAQAAQAQAAKPAPRTGK